MSCPGLHCAGCAGGIAMPVVPLVAAFGLAWVAENLIAVAVVSAVCGVLAVVAVSALIRWGDRRDARHVAARPLLITRPAPATLAATVMPKVTQPSPVAAIENHFHFHGTGSEELATRIIRQAAAMPLVPQELPR